LLFGTSCVFFSFLISSVEVIWVTSGVWCDFSEAQSDSYSMAPGRFFPDSKAAVVCKWPVSLSRVELNPCWPPACLHDRARETLRVPILSQVMSRETTCPITSIIKDKITQNGITNTLKRHLK
jgi:hypothetical protein